MLRVRVRSSVAIPVAAEHAVDGGAQHDAAVGAGVAEEVGARRKVRVARGSEACEYESAHAHSTRTAHTARTGREMGEYARGPFSSRTEHAAAAGAHIALGR